MLTETEQQQKPVRLNRSYPRLVELGQPMLIVPDFNDVVDKRNPFQTLGHWMFRTAEFGEGFITLGRDLSLLTEPLPPGSFYLPTGDISFRGLRFGSQGAPNWARFLPLEPSISFRDMTKEQFMKIIGHFNYLGQTNIAGVDDIQKRELEDSGTDDIHDLTSFTLWKDPEDDQFKTAYLNPRPKIFRALTFVVNQQEVA